MDLYTIIRTKDFQQTLKNILPTVGNWISSGLSALAGVAVVFICLLYIIFILMDMDKFRDEWINYVPKKFRRKAMMLAEDLDRNLNAYFRGQAMIALMVGILFAIGFQLIGLPMGIAMGLIIGVLNLVPYMQALGIPPCIILALIQSAESGRPVWLCLLLVAVVFIVVQTLQDLVLTPRIMGDAMGLTPAVILLALCVWGALFGVLGMIMALPLTTLMLSYYKRFVVDQEDASQA
jgi:predicted PurR-regulated permease PerM